MSEDAHDTPAPVAEVEPPMCDTCDQYKAPFHGHTVCTCQGVQPYSLSSYPGEYRMVRAHPDNLKHDGEGTQFYRREDVDPLLTILRRFEAEQTAMQELVTDPARPTFGEPDPAYPDPTPEDLGSPLFEAIWQAIKGWDLSRYGSAGPGRTLYSGASGNEVMHIIEAIGTHLLAPLRLHSVADFCNEQVPDGMGGKDARFKFDIPASRNLDAVNLVLGCAVEMLTAERIKASMFQTALKKAGAPFESDHTDKDWLDRWSERVAAAEEGEV